MCDLSFEAILRVYSQLQDYFKGIFANLLMFMSQLLYLNRPSSRPSTAICILISLARLVDFSRRASVNSSRQPHGRLSAYSFEDRCLSSKGRVF